jgi:hypothetical protein
MRPSFPVVILLLAMACGSEEGGGFSPGECQVGARCKGIVDTGVRSVYEVLGFLDGDILAVLYGTELEKELWRVGQGGPEKLADHVLPESVKIDEGGAAICFGTEPRRLPRDILDAGYVPVGLHRWRSVDGDVLLATNVMAGYHQICATGEFLWVWEPLEGWLNCGTLALVDLRAGEPGAPVTLGDVCQYADGDVLAAFTPDCREVVAAQPDLRVWPVGEPGGVAHFPIEPNTHLLSPDGRHVGFEPREAPGGLRFLRTSDGTTIFERHPASAPPLIYNADGQRVVYEVPATAEQAPHLEVYDFGSDKLIAIEVESSGVLPYDLSFSPDRTALALVRRMVEDDGETVGSALFLADLADGSVRMVARGIFNDEILGAWRKGAFGWRPELFFSDDGRYLTPPYSPPTIRATC